ncbi:unnamed protein product [Protopolystoma xenopodis]|uniref:Uncharacterized protein n=1 Tax=Protopolystoma xenopodis TaxID=117903 RepID=A0A3S5AIA3_9PLAT|nr:unnamed protein product [Protopolystoma xenopodis]
MSVRGIQEYHTFDIRKQAGLMGKERGGPVGNLDSMWTVAVLLEAISGSSSEALTTGLSGSSPPLISGPLFCRQPRFVHSSDSKVRPVTRATWSQMVVGKVDRWVEGRGKPLLQTYSAIVTKALVLAMACDC